MFGQDSCSIRIGHLFSRPYFLAVRETMTMSRLFLDTIRRIASPRKMVLPKDFMAPKKPKRGTGRRGRRAVFPQRRVRDWLERHTGPFLKATAADHTNRSESTTLLSRRGVLRVGLVRAENNRIQTHSNGSIHDNQFQHTMYLP